MLVSFTPQILIISGVAAASWLLEKLFKPTPFIGEAASGFVRIISVLGFFIGILVLLTEAGVWLSQAYDVGTQVLLTATGLALLLRPVKDVPWAAFVALLIGGFCVGLLILVYPLPETVLGISSSWIYIAVFLLPALFTYVLLKFAEDLLKLIAIILTFKPVTITLGLTCIIQGVLLLLNTSLFTVLFS